MRALPHVVAGLALAIGWSLLAASFLGLLDGGDAPASLAERINQACKPGYRVSDFGVGDEWARVPAGTVSVVCVRNRPDADGLPVTYRVAVQRDG